MTTDKIIKKIISTFKELQQRATEINSAHNETVLATCIQKDKRGKYDSLGFYNVKTKIYFKPHYCKIHFLRISMMIVLIKFSHH